MSNGLNISLKSYDSIFQSEEQRNTEEIKPVPISELKPFTEQPFKVKLDEDMDALVESIKQCGVLTPVIARPHKDGGYEILSGHRRVKACELAGITDIPVVIKNLDDDTPTLDTSITTVTMIWKYIGEVIFNMLVLVGLIKGADRIVKELFGT